MYIYIDFSLFTSRFLLMQSLISCAVIDQVMVEGGGDYDDIEDIDWPPNATGSDY